MLRDHKNWSYPQTSLIVVVGADGSGRAIWRCVLLKNFGRSGELRFAAGVRGSIPHGQANAGGAAAAFRII